MSAQAIGLGDGDKNKQVAPTGRPSSLFVIVDRVSHLGRIECRPVGAMNSDGFRHPGRWPGLTWGRPFGTEPQGIRALELETALSDDVLESHGSQSPFEP